MKYTNLSSIYDEPMINPHVLRLNHNFCSTSSWLNPHCPIGFMVKSLLSRGAVLPAAPPHRNVFVR